MTTIEKSITTDKYLKLKIDNAFEVLSVEELLKALLDGKKIKLKKERNGVNYWLENGELQSRTITYLKGIPQTWFNHDIKYVIDSSNND